MMMSPVEEYDDRRDMLIQRMMEYGMSEGEVALLVDSYDAAVVRLTAYNMVRPLFIAKIYRSRSNAVTVKPFQRYAQ